MTDLLDFFSENKIEFNTNISAKDISTFKIGGNLRYICYPDSTQKISDLMKFCKSNSIKYFVFGRCSNVVFPDEGINSLVIKTDRMCDIAIEDGVIAYGAGVMLAKASKFAIDNGYAGMEFSYGIPGSIGGAVYMNAGAYGGQMSDIIVKTEYVDGDGNILYLEKDEHDFSYRHSFFTNTDCVITKTFIKLGRGNREESEEIVKQLQTARYAKQPLEYPSAGSVFKRPKGYFAGKLIEDSGLKGMRFGGAMVSEKHAGFIINYDNAKCSDVEGLIRLIQDRVKNEYGVYLECEIKFIKDR